MATSPFSEGEENEQNFIGMEERAESPGENIASDESRIDEDGIQPLSSAETELPPEARGEANGGPLGCCLGLTVGLMLSLFLGLIGFGHVAALGLVALTHADLMTNIRIATGIFAVVGAFAGGYAGWKIGKHIYKEYELSSRQKERLAHLEERYRPKKVQS
jgi:hypothetical protein